MYEVDSRKEDDCRGQLCGGPEKGDGKNVARMGRAGGNWSSPHARQCRLSWAFAEIHVRREGEATSRNDPKSFYHLNIFLDFLEGEEAPEPCACHGGLKSLVSLAAPPFCPRGS